MYFIAEDSYHIMGLWRNVMCGVSQDGTTVNIMREECEVQVRQVMNLANMFSSRDAYDLDLFETDSEDRLVYVEETADVEMKDGKPHRSNVKIIITFCKASEHLKDKVVEVLKKKEKPDSIEVKYVDTFETSNDDVRNAVKECLCLDFDPETGEAKEFEGDNPKPESALSEIEIKADEIPF